MKLYSVNDLRERYPDKPSSTTIYKYFKLEELSPYVVEDDGKKLKEDGLSVLDQIRAKNEKYRAKVDTSTRSYQEENNQSKEEKAYKIECSGIDASDIKDLINSLKDQLRVKDEQLKEKDQQIKELHQVLYNTTNTIALQNGTIALQNGSLKVEDINEKINNTVQEIEVKETIIQESAPAPSKKSFFDRFRKR